MNKDHQETYNELLLTINQLGRSDKIVELLRDEVNTVRRATFLTRLKWLFLGCSGFYNWDKVPTRQVVEGNYGG